ncbi:glycosyltransferase family 39 protein [Actinoplanes sp. NBRC 101535]|uniref:glycosyltransferase family 39 protein n=1 Tax=Actinoplanes sp. NBRC 101535 TaxID=3032196 RepID=UPI0025579639|nr:glycosyltransferase family 39 protein [Actinoplanes sp. NBRC 101535]
MTDSPTSTRPERATRTRTPPPGRAVTPAGPPRRTTRAGDVLGRLLPSVVPGALMAGIGSIQAGRPTLSWDEVTSAEVAARSLPQIWDMIQNIDAVFGFYYAFLHFWSAVVGSSETDLRLPSIIAMAGGVALAAELGRRLFTPMIGLITGLILCVVPNTSRYAAEARPYAFACFFSVLALLMLVVAVRRGRAYTWIGYGLSVTFLGLAHLVALTTLAAHAVLIAAHLWRRRRWRPVAVWAGTVIAALVPLLPLAWLGAHQEDTQLHWVEPITLGRLQDMPAEITGSAEVAWLLIGLLVLASWRPLLRIAPIAALALGPLCALALVSALISPMWVARYLLVVLAPMAMLAAVALAGGREGWSRFGALRIVSVLLLLAVVSVPAQRQIRGPAAKKGPDYRTAAQVVARNQQPGDIVVYPPKNRQVRAGMDYYLDRLPTQPADPLVRVPSARTGLLIAEEYPDVAVHVDGARRIWLIVGDRRDDPVTARPGLRPLLDAEYRRVGFWQPKRATVALYEHVG